MSDLFQADIKTVAVLVPYPVDKAYDYKLPDGQEAEIGAYVRVPFSGREVIGVVWGQGTEDINPAKVKEIIEIYDLPPMGDIQREFIEWVAKYTMTKLGAVLKMALSVPKAFTPPAPVKLYQYNGDAPQKLTPQQQAVIDSMKVGRAQRPATIAKKAGCSTAVVTGLAKKNVLQTIESLPPPPCTNPDPAFGAFDLTSEQKEGAVTLKASITANAHQTILIDGVTGAGKTEVYFEGVSKALENDQQVLILLPEIALSNAFLDRFEKRFGCKPALWHSELSAVKRKTTWRGVATGETKVVVGARSALFLPYADLGLIVIDEEHDPSYKQEEGAIYHARDMAIVRAHLGKIPAVLVSATPSVETIQNVWQGRYAHIHLPARFGDAAMPDIHIIDMRADKLDAQHFISPTLQKAAEKTLEKGEQVLFFLNRRGYAPLTLCRTCGHRFECPRCSAWLVEHKAHNKLQCHHCGYNTRVPKNCPECDDTDSLAACGPGVERIREEVSYIFPDARISVLASDTTEDQQDLKQKLDEIQSGAVDIIIGTQIVAKGHHFPKLTCVGVIDADLGLSGGELRANERTYQLLHQVAGRAGRESEKSAVYLQTFMPEHKVMKAMASGDRNQFLQIELQEREIADMPPYSRLAGIIIAGRDEGQVIETCKNLARNAPHADNIEIFGPAPAPMSKLRGKYRYRFLVRTIKNGNIQKALDGWLTKTKTPSTVRITIDIDPQSFL